LRLLLLGVLLLLREKLHFSPHTALLLLLAELL
jgi:hypothetical protein